MTNHKLIIGSQGVISWWLCGEGRYETNLQCRSNNCKSDMKGCQKRRKIQIKILFLQNAGVWSVYVSTFWKSQTRVTQEYCQCVTNMWEAPNLHISHSFIEQYNTIQYLSSYICDSVPCNILTVFHYRVSLAPSIHCYDWYDIAVNKFWIR